MTKTNYKILSNPKYMGAYSMDDGQGGYFEIPAVITKITQEEVIGDKGEKSMKIIGYTDQSKPFILNAGSQKTMHQITKSRYVEDWVGASIIFYVMLNQRTPSGEKADVLRIKPGIPVAPPVDYSLRMQMLRECKTLADLQVIFSSYTKEQKLACNDVKEEMKGKLK